MADDDERLPGGSLHDEAFWRQITTATASALSTGGIAFLAARFWRAFRTGAVVDGLPHAYFAHFSAQFAE